MGSKRNSLTRRDIERFAKRAKKHAKKHPDHPEFILPGLYWANTVTRLSRLDELGGKPMKRWWISGFDQSKEEKGKCKIQLRYMTKAEKGFLW